VLAARRLKRALGFGLVHTPAVHLLRLATGDEVTIYVLHRFGVTGMATTQDHLRRALAHLRRNHYQLLALEEVVRRLRDGGPPLRKAVCFTIDDGYLDQATVGAPVFLEFDCPVTVFLTTGFLDGAVVPWWDKVGYAIQTTSVPMLEVSLAGRPVSYSLSSGKERFQAEMNFLARCKDATDVERRAGIAALGVAAKVTLPDRPVSPNLPMSWDQARCLEGAGVTFGAHTVSHPILSHIGAEAAEWEIKQSWQRLQEELDHPIPIFCYPNGRLTDFGHREIDVIRRLGMTGAVTVDEAHVDMRAADPDAPFRLSRVPLPDTMLDTLFQINGLDRVQAALAPRSFQAAP